MPNAAAPFNEVATLIDIVQVIGDGTVGGGTTYVIELATQLVRHGHHTTIITDAGSFLEGQARTLGASAIGLPFKRRRNTPVLAALLHHHLGMIRPAVVHAHGARAGLPVSLITEGKPWNFIYTVHGLHYTDKRNPFRSLGWLAERVCMRRADKVVFVARHDREAARQSGLLRGVSHPVVVLNAAKVDIELGLPAEKTYDIGFLGRLVPEKNPLVLCDVLVAMRPRRPTLVVIGDGILQWEFRARVERLGLMDQVTMTGELPRADALRTLSQCRTFVLPSRHEGQPLAAIEAAYLGLPAVVSALPGTQEIVTEGETGYTVDITDVAGYADRLGRLLTDPDLATRISVAARNKAVRDFDFDRIVEAHLRLYELSWAATPTCPADRRPDWAVR